MFKLASYSGAVTASQDILPLLDMAANAKVLEFTLESSAALTLDIGVTGELTTYSNNLIGLSAEPYGVAIPQIVVSASATITINVKYQGGN